MAVGVGQTEYSLGFLLMKLIWLVTIISGIFSISRSGHNNSWSKVKSQKLTILKTFSSEKTRLFPQLQNRNFPGVKYFVSFLLIRQEMIVKNFQRW